VAVDPIVQISFIESPALVDTDLSQSVANHLLFEAIASETAVFSGFVKAEDALCSRTTIQRLF
jgi:hypothetical protein